MSKAIEKIKTGKILVKAEMNEMGGLVVRPVVVPHAKKFQAYRKEMGGPDSMHIFFNEGHKATYEFVNNKVPEKLRSDLLDLKTVAWYVDPYDVGMWYGYDAQYVDLGLWKGGVDEAK